MSWRLSRGLLCKLEDRHFIYHPPKRKQLSVFYLLVRVTLFREMMIRRYASGVTIDQILQKQCYNVPIINRLTLTRCFLDVDVRTKQLFATDVQYSSWWEGKYI